VLWSHASMVTSSAYINAGTFNPPMTGPEPGTCSLISLQQVHEEPKQQRRQLTALAGAPVLCAAIGGPRRRFTHTRTRTLSLSSPLRGRDTIGWGAWMWQSWVLLPFFSHFYILFMVW
jgi:hypothetical protein